MTIEIRCNICGQNVPEHGTRGYIMTDGGLEEVYAKSGDVHVCGSCYSVMLSNQPRTPAPEYSKDPEDLAIVLATVIAGDKDEAIFYIENARQLISRGVRVLKDNSPSGAPADPEPSGLPPEVAGY